MHLTKQLINKFKSPEIEVRVMNGYFKTASARVVYSNGHEYIVRVEHTPKELQRFGNFNSEKFLYPEGRCSWTVYDVPDELKFVSDNLSGIVKYTDAEIKFYLNRMSSAVDEFNKSFYGENHA